MNSLINFGLECSERLIEISGTPEDIIRALVETCTKSLQKFRKETSEVGFSWYGVFTVLYMIAVTCFMGPYEFFAAFKRLRKIRIQVRA
jgi:hypothetical protein